MSRRFLLLTGGFFLVCVGLVFLTAYSVGADPLHPRSRNIWALSLIAALYASVRLAMIAGKIIDAQSGEGDPVLFGLFGKKDHAIDKRLAARKARVEAAQKRANETNEVNKDTGDE
ncbi:MAG: hypothetical protein ABJH52_04100 [Henriciella sp.]